MSTFFERLMQTAGYKGIKNVQKLSEYLEYSSPEKLYRLERNPEAKPSFNVLCDISKKFDNLDMNWLITGKSSVKQYQNDDSKSISTNEKPVQYNRITFEEILAARVAEKMEPMLNQIRKNVEYILVRLNNIENNS